MYFSKVVYLVLGVFVFSTVFSCKKSLKTTKGCNDIEACNYDENVSVNDESSCAYICLTDEEKQRVVDFVDTAVVYISDNGIEESLNAFNAPNPSEDFIDGEMYVFVFRVNSEESATMIAHGALEEMINTEVYDIQGEKGRYIVREFIKIADAESKGWGWYYWADKTDNNTVKKKFSYVVKIDDLIVGAGTYMK